ncbi:hypothetical protein Ddye_022648 [Dipteronia dyeriana]|uniref:Disease resistance protein Roq1-like winged-helix domain-containing protein n=1 Tax=Dipteronia dyeriana TaxID=168575 RepID=A0AAD9TSD3_9ROSI|nr:hypothetical protein Ddye_022648 [Dipteronia dyeriana]
MKKLERILHEDIYEVLKISYDGLNDNQQRIFLDIACFLKGKGIDLVKQFLNACGFFTEVEISGLVDKSLIAISKYNTINMHDLLQAMGREIVRQQSIEDLGQQSRLWHHEDIYHVLTKNLRSKAIQGISFDMSRTEYIDLNPCAFANMRNVRYLEFYCSNDGENKNKVHISKGLDSVFNELRYLHRYGCPLKSLQSNVNPEHLVKLRMRDSNVEQLWNGVMNLVNLKEIDLAGSKHLISCPDLSGACNLERLNLLHCSCLSEISSSLQYLSKLDKFLLLHCKSLRGLPDCFAGLKSLKYLNMFGCSNLKMLPDISCY